MKQLPFTQVVAALRTAAKQAGSFSVRELIVTLPSVVVVPADVAARTFVRIAASASAHPSVTHEVELELRAMPEKQRVVARTLAAALAQLPEHAALVQRACTWIATSATAAIGAAVPPAAVIDATLLQACRDARGAEDLARRVAWSLGLPITGEDEATSEARLRALDPEIAATAARVAELEKRLRASLPKV